SSLRGNRAYGIRTRRGFRRVLFRSGPGVVLRQGPGGPGRDVDHLDAGQHLDAFGQVRVVPPGVDGDVVAAAGERRRQRRDVDVLPAGVLPPSAASGLACSETMATLIRLPPRAVTASRDRKSVVEGRG